MTERNEFDRNMSLENGWLVPDNGSMTSQQRSPQYGTHTHVHSSGPEPVPAVVTLREAMGPGYQVSVFKESVVGRPVAVGVQVRPTGAPSAGPRRRQRRAHRGFGLRLNWWFRPVAIGAPCPSC